MNPAGSAVDLEADTLLLNVAIIPTGPVAAIAVALSDQLQVAGGLLRVDGITRFPHLTLYMARFAQAAVGNVCATLSRAVATHGCVRLEQAGYYVTPGNYYEISYDRSIELLDLHRHVTGAVQSLRFSPGAPAVEGYFGVYSDDQEVSARQTGYDLAGGLYRPHITLSRFSRQPDDAALPTAREDLSFSAAKIGLYEADSMGAARRLITTFSLTSHQP